LNNLLDSMTASAPPGGTPPTPTLRNKALVKTLQRVNQGEIVPGNNIVSLAITRKADPANKDDKDTPFASVNVRVNHYYNFSLNTGVVWTSVRHNSIFATPGATTVDASGNSTTGPSVVSQHSDPRLMPVLAVTYFWRKHSYADRTGPHGWQRLYPNPAIGFRLDSPGSDFIAGVNFEPLSGILLSCGFTLGQQAQIDLTVDASGVPNTFNAWKVGGYAGVMFDVNLFGSQLLQLAGFGL
jgi:hypothetical protein